VSSLEWKELAKLWDIMKDLDGLNMTKSKQDEANIFQNIVS
jgi:hypothetical protein